MLDRPFIDSAGKIGKSFVKKYNHDLTSRSGLVIEFGVYDSRRLRVNIPTLKPILITKLNAIKLAHWLLDHSTEGGSLLDNTRPKNNLARKSKSNSKATQESTKGE